MAKAKKLPSGNWRVLVYTGKNANGKREYQSVTADTKKEAEFLAAQISNGKKTPKDMTARDAIVQYIEQRRNIASPSTIQGYEKILKNNLQGIMSVSVRKLNESIIQDEVNKEAVKLSPKTLKNAIGLLSSALKRANCDVNFGLISLPQQKRTFKQFSVTPEEIFKAFRGTDMELPVLLAMWLSLSISEIRGIKKEDIDPNGILTLKRTIVDVNGKAIEKDTMKEFERARQLQVPEYILKIIDARPDGFLVPINHGSNFTRKYTARLKECGLQHITFHDLRHVNASVMMLLHVPDKYAQERGGWSDPSVMKRVYQNTFTKERLAIDQMIDDYFNDIAEKQ